MTTDVSQLPQGDLRLLESEMAQRLLGSSIPARVAYTGADGTPRAIPIWFEWTGEEIVMGTFPGSPKVAALRAQPDVAITIDTDSSPPDVLLLRGKAVVTDVPGVVEEYAAAAARYLGAGAKPYLRQLERNNATMVRIAVRPTWVGLLDFRTRMPGTLGGVRQPR